MEVKTQGFGEQDVDAIERWRFSQQQDIKAKKNRLLQRRSDVLKEHFYDTFGRRIANPPEEANEDLRRIDAELAACEVESREIDAEAERRRYAPLDVEAMAEAARAELEELQERRRTYAHGLYVQRLTVRELDLREVEARIGEIKHLLERYELAADAERELLAREEEGT